MGLSRSGRSRSAAALAVLVVLVSIGAPIGGADLGASGSAAQVGSATRQSRSVEVELEVGLNGIVAGPQVPVRITLVSPRARSAVLELNTNFGMHSVSVDLPAEAPTAVDLLLDQPIGLLTVEVRDGDGERGSLGRRSVEVVSDLDIALVAVGPGLPGAPATSPTIGAIQDAALLPLDDALWQRSGALDSVSGIVLSATDVDALSESQRNRLREWVWNGGDLAVDSAPADSVPVADVMATGARTAVGAGWIRFTDGAAARGEWTSVVAPAVPRADGINQNMGMMAVDEGSLEFLGLITIDFLPAWALAIAVFGTALMVGPVLWFVLRTRSRRRWMWVTAPTASVLVAVAVLLGGDGVFAKAEVGVLGQMRASRWSTHGTVIGGLAQTVELDLEPGAAVLASTVDTTVDDVGGGVRSLRAEVPPRTFGAIALSGVTLDGPPTIEASATWVADGSAEVTITNTSSEPLTQLTIAGSGQTEDYDDVPPNATVTVPFALDDGGTVLGPVFPVSQPNQVNGPMVDFDGSDQAVADMVAMQILDPTMFGLTAGATSGAPSARGVVVVSGVQAAPVGLGGLKGRATMRVSTVAPVVAATAEPSFTLRIDELGAVTLPARANLANMAAMNGMDGGGPVATTIVVGGATTSSEPGQGPPGYVRLSSPTGRPAAPCAVHTVAEGLEMWDGTSWVPMATVGERHPDARLRGFMGDDSEVQNWMIPEIPAGGELYVRVGSIFLTVPPPQLFVCSEPA